MLSDLLRADRERAGLKVEQAARRLRISLSGYRELQASERVAELGTYERCAAGVGFCSWRISASPI
jgi:hypothetical protein